MALLCKGTTQISPTIQKHAPCGTAAGIEKHIDDIIGGIARIVRMIICHGSIINGLTVYCERFNDEMSSYSFGGTGGVVQEIYFERDEYIVCVRGTIGPMNNVDYVRSIEIVTNHNKVYGPFGEENKRYPFEFKAQGSKKIIGFHGRSEGFVDAIGVYVKEEKHEKISVAEDAHRREQAQKQLKEALNTEKRKNEQTAEELEKTRGELGKLKQSLADKESQLMEAGETLSKLHQTQELLNKKEKDYHKLDCLYRELQNEYQEKLGNQKVINENKALKRMEILAKEYEKFRIWMEYQASISYGMVMFTEFTDSQIHAAIENSNHLGQGGYGDVRKAVIEGTTVAIKIPFKGSKQGKKEFESEVKILTSIRHPNLVTLIGACQKLDALVYEFLPNGSLQDHLFPTEDQRTLTWRERIKITADICSALVFLHNTKPNPIAHGDLKPSNILFDLNNACKLSDFGISRLLKYNNDTITPNHITQLPKGTPFYRDPEFEESRKLTPQADVYAFGIIMLQLVTGKGPNKIRDFVFRKLQTTLDDIKLEKFKERTTQQQKKLLEKLLESAKLVEWPIDVAVKMTSLGLWCSSDERKDRPDLVTQVWSEIESMNGFDADN